MARLLDGYPFDVLLGSVHWLGTWQFDLLHDEECLAEWDRRRVEDVWRRYTEALEELAATRTCDVLAHPDFVKLAGRRPSAATLDECHDRMAEAARASKMAAEISSAGFHAPVGEQYPATGLLSRFAARGVPVTTASDSHGPGCVGERAGELGRLAAAAGYTTLRAFGSGSATMWPSTPGARRRGRRDAVTSAEVARRLEQLPEAARDHLESLMGSWGMLADLSFSDLVCYVPVVAGGPAGGPPPGKSVDQQLVFVALGQMRPTTSQTLFALDLVGETADEAAEGVLVREAWGSGQIVVGDCPYSGETAPVRCQCIPVRFEDAVIAVLVRVWSPRTGRRTGGLERVYRRIFERLASMVAAGLFPFHTGAAAVADTPRVGDGVIVLDENRRVTFASPNAVNALHRMGIVSQIVGSGLDALEAETHAVSRAFTGRLPVIEEIEPPRGRRGDPLHPADRGRRRRRRGAAPAGRDRPAAA